MKTTTYLVKTTHYPHIISLRGHITSPKRKVISLRQNSILSRQNIISHQNTISSWWDRMTTCEMPCRLDEMIYRLYEIICLRRGCNVLKTFQFKYACSVNVPLYKRYHISCTHIVIINRVYRFQLHNDKTRNTSVLVKSHSIHIDWKYIRLMITCNIQSWRNQWHLHFVIYKHFAHSWSLICNFLIHVHTW